jgi:hypothetical protein
MKKVLVLLLLSITIFSACKKKDVEKTTTEKITGSWKFVSAAYNYFNGTTSSPSSNNGIAGDYYDFRADGKVYLQEGGVKDTVAYSILSDNKIKFDGDDFDVKVLTDNQFVLYNKYVYPNAPTKYDETTYNLSK